MSLIHQALKEEQDRRSGNLNEPTAQVQPASTSDHYVQQPQRSSRQKNHSLALLIFFGGGILLTTLITGVIYFGSDFISNFNFSASTPEAIFEDPAEPAPSPIAAQAPQPKEISIEEAKATAKTIDIAAIKAEAKAEAYVQNSTISNPQSDPAIQAYVDSLVFHGVRSAGSNSRLLIKGRVYRIGDILDPHHGVRFSGIRNGKIIFKDNIGASYLRYQ